MCDTSLLVWKVRLECRKCFILIHNATHNPNIDSGKDDDIS